MFARFSYALVFGLLLAIVSPAVNGDAAESAAPEEVLSSNGLSKFGAYYVLEPDLKLGDWLRVLQATEKKYTDAKKHYAALQNQSKQVNDLMQNLGAQNDAQTRILEQIPKAADGSYNHQVDIVNAVRKKLRECIKIADETEKELQATPEPTNEQYVAMVVKLSDMMELVSRRYEELAADSEVKSALQRINQTARPAARLGPSLRFAEQLPLIRRLRATVASVAIRLDSIDGVAEVPVTLNDTVRDDMVLDANAAYVCITPAVAEKLGMQTEASNKTTRVTIGAGKTIDAHLVTLLSVHVGDFVLENVACAIEPPEMKGAKNILGASFLRHFVYRMDTSAGELHLSQVDGKPLLGSKNSEAAESTTQFPPVPPLP